MDAIKRITKERKEQIQKHGQTIALDVKHNKDGQLLQAAGHLIANHLFVDDNDAKSYHRQCLPKGWKVKNWMHMCNKPKQERLIIAASLIAAEYDRVEEMIKIEKSKAK